MKVVVFGGGGHAKVVIEACQEAGATPIVCFAECDSSPILGVEVIAEEERTARQWLGSGLRHAVVAVGDNSIRRRVATKATDWGFELLTIVDPTARVSRYASVGLGSVVLAGAVVQPSATIGRLAIINTQASVDHDCVLGDAVHVAPNSVLCGNVRCGTGCWIGAGSTVIERIELADEVYVAAGAVVTRNVLEHGARVAGVPARRLGKSSTDKH